MKDKLFRSGIFFIVSILASGMFDRALANPTDLDVSFNNGGLVRIGFNDEGSDVAHRMALQPDGKVVIAGGLDLNGRSPRIVRLNPDGSPDLSFNGTGKLILDEWPELYIGGLAAQPDGKLILVGSRPQDGLVMIRLNIDGSIDTSFGKGGSVPVNSAYADGVVIQPDGKIVLGGQVFPHGPSVLRFMPDGTPDRSFGRGGLAYLSGGGGFRTIALQPDGKILCAGTTGENGFAIFLVARFLPNGTLDAGFGNGGTVHTSVSNVDDIATSIAISPEGKIAVAGYAYEPGINSDFIVALYHADGSLDTSFNGTGKVHAYLSARQDRANSVAFRPDGTIVLGGFTSGWNYYNDEIATLRLRADGQADNRWGINGVARSYFTGNEMGVEMALDSLARPLVAGTCGSEFCLARFTSEYAPVSNVTVSGRIYAEFGLGAGQATVKLTDSAGNARTVRTNPFGYYAFDNVQTGGVYTITVSAKRYRYYQLSFTVSGELTGMDFIPNG